MSYMPTLKELENLSDEEIIKRHDAMAANTLVGTAFYADELARRQTSAQNDKMLSLTKKMEKLTWAMLILTLINIVVVFLA